MKRVNFRAWLTEIKRAFNEVGIPRTDESYFYMEWWNDVRDMMRLT